MEEIKKLRSEFKKPSSLYRSVPLWSWNDHLDLEELERQAREMKEQGMGGFFIHSREGLEDEYLGSKWMESVKKIVQGAKELGLGAWIYDDDRWPSGAAGGLVAEQDPARYSARGLTLEMKTEPTFLIEKENTQVLAVFRAEVEQERILECERMELGRTMFLKDSEVWLIFRNERSEISDWYNHQSPPDNLNPDTVRAFIEVTHERYRKEMADEFGETIPGFFTDEPNIADFFSKFTEGRPWLPWTGELPSFFKNKKGYDLVDFIPYLFFSGKHSTKARHDYWQIITERFSHCYSKQLYDWCVDNRLQLTGHYLFENDLGYGARVCGAVMPHYRYMHIPGIDILGNQIEEFLTVKQCSSVANQYGRKFVISETYGTSGWDFTFEDQKWLGDWQFALGVNLRSQHHALYSLKGIRKRDFPPVFNYNTSWWKYNHVMEDYFARITSVMSQGRVIRDVLVLHPASSIWTMTGSLPTEDLQNFDSNMGWRERHIMEVNKEGEKFNRFIQSILASHYDLDLGDEIIINESGKVKDGKFFVNLASYQVVILPPLKTLFKSTVNLLEQFLDAGGKVIAVTPLPSMIEGQESEGIQSLFQHNNMIVVQDTSDLIQTVESILPRRVKIRNKHDLEAESFLYMFRELEDAYALFVVNTDRKNDHEVRISLQDWGKVEEWNLLTGEVTEVSVKEENGELHFISTFGSTDSKLFIILKNTPPQIKDIEFKYRHPHVTEEIVTALGPVCSFTRTSPNALVLDKCKFQIGDGAWSEEMDVWMIQRELRQKLGMRQIYSTGLPQRYKWTNEKHPKDETPVQFKFHFQVKDVPENQVYLVAEESEHFEIFLNGTLVSNRTDGWFLDRSFHKVKLPHLIKGQNELILCCNYLNRMEMEDVYLIGEFAVGHDRSLIRESNVLHFGDWCFQGYSHYCGSIIYHLEYNHQHRPNKKTIIEFGQNEAVTIEVKVNGKHVAHVPWRIVDGLDISSFVMEGSNRIDIEVMGSPVNLLGPLHRKFARSSRIEWSDFRTEGSLYTSEYVLHPYGLMGQIKVVQR